MTNEEIYDSEIAPKLLEIANRCKELGFNFIAQCEWELNETGRTEFTNSNTRSCKQALVHWAARCNGNVDALIMAIDRNAKKHGHSSMYLKMLGNDNIQYSGNEIASIAITTTP